MPPPVILIPVNRLDRAKGRLAAILTQSARERLAVATLTTVWNAACEAATDVFVLTADARVAAILGPAANIIAESPDLQGLNAQLTAATNELVRRRPGQPLLILHADLPLATADDINGLIAAAALAASVTVVRSADGGTNAMFQAEPGRLTLAYGSDSAAHHEANARAAGLSFALRPSAALELDLDTPADITTLLATPHGPATLAGQALAATNTLGAHP